MRKIMFHLNCFEQGGAERVVSNLANRFSEGDCEIVVATEWQGENEFKLSEKVNRIHVGMREEDEKKHRLIKALLRVKYLRECIKKEQPDVVVAFAHKANYRALMATRFMRKKVPVIIAVRINPIGNYDALSDKILIPLLFPKAAGAVFQTKEQRDYFLKNLKKQSEIIINPVNEKYVKEPDTLTREKTVVHSGRLVDFKNQALLIDAFEEVHKKHPDYDLKMYGGDSFDGTKEILDSKIAAYGAESYIHLMGASDSLEKQLPKGAVYVLSSDYEGMPNALLEAMALGLPVVATDCPCGGPATLIENEVNGLLVPIQDKDKMADAICRLIEDREFAERLGKNARQIAKVANVDTIMKQWRDYIEKVIGWSK